MRKSVVSGFTDKMDFQIGNVWNILSFFMATDLTLKLFHKKNSCFTFISNKTSLNFITTDQPVINLKRNDLDKSGHVKTMEFYYPLSPDCALLINFDKSIGLKFEGIEIDESEVQKYNELLLSNSESFIFSNNIETLNTIKAHYN
jgi:hypothetical protein